MVVITKITYTGNGVTKAYLIPFDYLSRSHVKVTVNENTVPYTYTSASTISFTAAPTNGALIQIQRQTPYEQPFIVWTDGTVLLADELNQQLLQCLFVLQENQTILGSEALRLNSLTNTWNADNKRLSDLSPAQLENDAVTLSQLSAWLTGTANPQLQTLVNQTIGYLNQTIAQREQAELCANRSCVCAETAQEYYSKIAEIFAPNFFSTFFILSGVSDGKQSLLEITDIDDGGTSSSVLLITDVSEGTTSSPTDWYIVNPIVADSLRGRSIISAELQTNGELILTTD